jgi:hypothetical protein
MKIIVKPSDLISRFLWDKFEYFCLDNKSNAEIAQIIQEDQEFEISENDAFVIGLTNVIYTSEAVYKFKQYLKEILENKSFEQDKKLYINKDILVDSISDFKRKIPKNWQSQDPEFNNALASIPGLWETFIKTLAVLPTITVQECACVKYGSVKKIINKL